MLGSATTFGGGSGPAEAVFAEALFAATAARVPAALLWHGVVKAAAVPGGVDPTTVTPSSTGAQIRFV